MLKTRVIAVLIVKQGFVVQSIGFKKYLPVGSVEVAIEYLNQWGIDEIVVLDIDATKENRTLDLLKLDKISTFAQTPLTIGGGIKKMTDVENMVRHGADKVVVNTEFLSQPSFLSQAAKQFGRQCMIASIDAVKLHSNRYSVFNKNIAVKNDDVVYCAKLAQDSGAGEIFLNSVDYDGKKCGYDLKLLELVKKAVNLPVILCGGVGKVSHLIEGAKAGADAVAAGNFFHFTEMSVVAAKQMMIQAGLNVRLDTYATFGKAVFDVESDRPLRLSEDDYEKMRFDYIPEETI